MFKNDITESWDAVPAIRIIIVKKLTLGPGGQYLWNQTNVRGPYWRIYWNNSPGGFVSCNGTEVELTPDKVVVLSPDAVYSTRAEKLVNHFYVHCFAASPFSEIKGQIFVLKNTGLIRQASSLAMKAGPDFNQWRTQMEFMVYLNSVLLSIPVEKIPDVPRYSPKIAWAMKLLETREKISNEELAGSVNMSRNGFLLLFKKETGTSPQSYSRQLRLNEACVMLQYGNKSIDEIAQETGFCDRYHFSRAFRQLIKCSPGQFRAEKSL